VSRPRQSLHQEHCAVSLRQIIDRLLQARTFNDPVRDVPLRDTDVSAASSIIRLPDCQNPLHLSVSRSDPRVGVAGSYCKPQVETKCGIRPRIRAEPGSNARMETSTWVNEILREGIVAREPEGQGGTRGQRLTMRDVIGAAPLMQRL